MFHQVILSAICIQVVVGSIHFQAYSNSIRFNASEVNLLDDSTAFSFHAWVYVDSGTEPTILASQGFWNWGIFNTNGVRYQQFIFSDGFNGGAAATTYTCNQTVAGSTFVTHTLVYDGAGTLRMYVDEDECVFNSAFIDLSSDNGYIYAGSDPYDFSVRQLDGYIHDLSIWIENISESKLQRLLDQPISRNCSCLQLDTCSIIHYFPCYASKSPPRFEQVRDIIGKAHADYYDEAGGFFGSPEYVRSPAIWDDNVTHCTNAPTVIPTNYPTYIPSSIPTNLPSTLPTHTPSYVPSKSPSNNPTSIPTKTPSNLPSSSPTPAPTNVPTVIPTQAPSMPPTNTPTYMPSAIPTAAPSGTPTNEPTKMPTLFDCVPTCTSDPCDCEDAENCEIFQFDYGCHSCDENYFQLSINHPCTHCQTYFGSECLSCEDTQGCSLCIEGYTLKYYDFCDLYYCSFDIPMPSHDPTPSPSDVSGNGDCPVLCDSNPCSCGEIFEDTCKICHDGQGCSECENGYFRPSNTNEYQCTSCAEYAGEGCKHCQTGTGCGQCKSGYQRVYDQDCGLYKCI